MSSSVTGGTGFLGQALVRLLADKGGEVRVLHRKPEDSERIRKWGATPVRGDLCTDGSSDGLVAPGDVVYHLAARVDLGGPWSEFKRTTITGTRRLLAAALPRRPARFVYVSSAAVYAWDRPNSPISAAHTPVRPTFYNLYGRAKGMAEKLVQRMCTQAGCPWTIVRLGFLYGPHNQAMVRRFGHVIQRDQLWVVGNGQNRIATCYLDDAARAVLLAGIHPAAAGQIYDVASDEPVTQRQFLDATCEALGLPRPRRRCNTTMAHLLVSALECVTRLTGESWPVTRTMVALMAADQVIDASKISRELGWRPQVSFREGMQRTQTWYRHARQNGSKNGQ